MIGPKTSSVIACVGLTTLVGVAGTSVSGQSPREWRDYAGGPDSSKFVAAKQITKSNVRQLQVAWAYPGGQTDFNPLVVRGMVYGRGPNGSFVALDAATGKQIWIHEGVQGFTSRGVNYWESKDGKDRRLDFQHTESAPGTRRLHRRADYGVRHQRSGGSTRRARSRSNDDQPADVAHPGACSRTSSFSARRPTKSTARHQATFARSTSARANSCGRFTPCPAPASSATTRGRRMRGRRSAAPTTGASNRSTKKEASSTCRWRARNTTSTAVTARARTSLVTASLRWTQEPANGSGISRWFTTTSGISTTTRRHN